MSESLMRDPWDAETLRLIMERAEEIASDRDHDDWQEAYSDLRWFATVQAQRERAERAERKLTELIPCTCAWVGGSHEPTRRTYICPRCAALAEARR